MTSTTLPEEAVKAAANALRENRWLVPGPAIELILTAALPHLPQGVDEREVVLNYKAKLRVAFRKALSDLPEIAPSEVASILSSVHMRDEFWSEGKRLQLEHGLDAVAPRVEQECGAGAWSFIRQGILSALEPSAGRAAVLEDAAKNCEREAAEVEGLIDDVAYHLRKRAAAIRALHPVADKPDEAGAQGDGWLPIESAPKDGTEVIYLTKYGSIGFCRYAVDDINDWFGWWDLQADDEVYPKRWIPRSALPSAPSQEVAGS